MDDEAVDAPNSLREVTLSLLVEGESFFEVRLSDASTDEANSVSGWCPHLSNFLSCRPARQGKRKLTVTISEDASNHALLDAIWVRAWAVRLFRGYKRTLTSNPFFFSLCLYLPVLSGYFIPPDTCTHLQHTRARM